MSTPQPASPRIVRLLKIVDTRQREERDGMYSSFSVPIAGTGVENVCQRCGAGHEVHAYVELSDGSQAVVGTGCAKRDAMDAGDAALAKLIAAADRRAKAVAKQRAEVARLERLVGERAASDRAIDRMRVPPVETRPADNEGRRFELTCGDARVGAIVSLVPRLDFENAYDVERRHREARAHLAEREESARRAWRERRHHDFGTGDYRHVNAAYDLKAARERLAKLESA